MIYIEPRKIDFIEMVATDELVVSVNEVKRSARIDEAETMLDDVIERNIKTVQKKIEKWAGLTLLKTRFKGFYDSFPFIMMLTKRPELQVEKIEYLDPTGTMNILDSEKYQVQEMEKESNVFPTENNCFPSTMMFTVDSVQITFVVGYASKSDVPDDIKDAVIDSVVNMIQGDCGEGTLLTKKSKALLRSYRANRV